MNSSQHYLVLIYILLPTSSILQPSFTAAHHIRELHPVPKPLNCASCFLPRLELLLPVLINSQRSLTAKHEGLGQSGGCSAADAMKEKSQYSGGRRLLSKESQMHKHKYIARANIIVLPEIQLREILFLSPLIWESRNWNFCHTGRPDGAEAEQHRRATETISERAVVASETTIAYLHRKPHVCFGS